MKTVLSIRQPWAWLIANGFKDIENRTWPTNFRGRFLIHAGKTMTRADYEAAVVFVSGIPAKELAENFWFPSPESVRAQMGGIVGEAEIVGCVTHSTSPWFCGEYGFEIKNAVPLEFQPCKGSLFMTDSEINQAIAEACGRKLNTYYCSQCRECVGIDTVTSGGYHAKCGGPVQRDCPKYVGSLDAMHEAEATLDESQCRTYNELLCKIVIPLSSLFPPFPAKPAPHWLFHASARQRAEAFLKTIGKWQ